MKYIFIALPLCALMACGGKDGGTNNDSTPSATTTTTAPASTQFPLINFGTNTIVKTGAGLDMTAEEVKKLQGQDSLDTDDELYLTYFYKLGSGEEDNQYTIDFSIDSETKKVWQIYYNISTPDSASGRLLYKDIVNSFNSKYGQGTNADYGKYDSYEWTTTINGIKTRVSVDRSQTSYYGSLSVYFDHADE